jgi:hypothetical protein
MGDDNHVISRKLCGFQGRVDGRVVMKEQCGACSDFLSNLLANSITDPSGVSELLDEFSIFSTFSVVFLVLGRP